MRKRRLCIVALAAAIAFTASALEARPTRTIFVAARMLDLLDIEASEILVVYDPNDPNVTADADALREDFSKLKLRDDGGAIPVRMIDVAALGGLEPDKIIYVPDLMSAHHARIAEAVRGTGALTVTMDDGCARQGYCVISINLTPRTQILFSRRAGDAAGIEFSASFRSLVKEV